MRLIKFRAWDGEEMTIFSLEIDSVGYLPHPPVPPRNSSFKELMQYTGLKDKNGVEIYEGDILTNGLENDVVEWNQEDGCWNVMDSIPPLDRIYMWHDNAEVIGNIYQNKDLLK